MSIRDLIRECVDGGELARLTPSLPGASHMREMFVSPHVLKFLRGDKSTPRHLIKKAMDTRVALERFIEGAWINVAMDPDNKSSIAELARNREVEEGVWNFRIRDPKPQIRVFGGFAERDHFIALDYRNRDDLSYSPIVGQLLA